MDEESTFSGGAPCAQGGRCKRVDSLVHRLTAHFERLHCWPCWVLLLPCAKTPNGMRPPLACWAGCPAGPIRPRPWRPLSSSLFTRDGGHGPAQPHFTPELLYPSFCLAGVEGVDPADLAARAIINIDSERWGEVTVGSAGTPPGGGRAAQACLNAHVQPVCTCSSAGPPSHHTPKKSTLFFVPPNLQAMCSAPSLWVPRRSLFQMAWCLWPLMWEACWAGTLVRLA